MWAKQFVEDSASMFDIRDIKIKAETAARRLGTFLEEDAFVL